MLGGVLFVSLMDDLEKHLESRGYTLIWGSLLSSSTCVFLLFSFFCSIKLIQYVSLVLSLRVEHSRMHTRMTTRLDAADPKLLLPNQFLNIMTKHYKNTLPNSDLCWPMLETYQVGFHLVLKVVWRRSLFWPYPVLLKNSSLNVMHLVMA